MEDREYPLSAYLVNPQGNHNGRWLGFPTTQDGFQAALKAIGLTDGGVVICQYYATDIEHLASRLPDAMSVETLDELNYLAAKLDVMTEPQREVFEAVLESGRHCGSMKDMINVMENPDGFDLEPAYSPAQLGEHWLDMSKDEYAGAFGKIEKSDDPDLHELAAYIEYLEKHFDAKSYALERAETEGGCFAKHGYLTEHNDFLEAYRCPEDIPCEYRVFGGPKPERDVPKRPEPRRFER